MLYLGIEIPKTKTVTFLKIYFKLKYSNVEYIAKFEIFHLKNSKYYWLHYKISIMNSKTTLKCQKQSGARME